MLSRPVTSGKVMEPGAVLQMDNFYWKHTMKEVHVKGTLLVDASSRAAVVWIWRTAHRQELLGKVSASEARRMLLESWFKFYGRPETVMTDPEGSFEHKKISYRGDRCSIKVQHPSPFQDNTATWVRIVIGVDEYVTESMLTQKEEDIVSVRNPLRKQDQDRSLQ